MGAVIRTKLVCRIIGVQTNGNREQTVIRLDFSKLISHEGTIQRSAET